MDRAQWLDTLENTHTNTDHPHHTLEFNTPAIPKNPKGQERSVGFEFEFTGMEMEVTARMIADLYGGTPEPKSTYHHEVIGTRFGDFSLELDASLLLHKKYEELLASVGIDISSFKNKDKVEEAVRELASTVVPFEIITPPIPLGEMKQLNRLVDALREVKAKGTGSSLFYAFGLHINPEAPEFTAASILNHLKAYVLLDPWLREDGELDFSRNLSPYLKAYEPDYIRFILQEDYHPDLRTLIRKHIEFGNTRNRPLDLLPLFMHLEPELTRSLLDDDLTSARPTYHYRLPNCSIEIEDWSLADEWNRWCLVEQLAADETQLDKLSQLYRKMDGRSFFGFKRKWIRHIEAWRCNES